MTGGSAAPICYEIIFPAAVTEPDNRPAWLLNMTNHGRFGNTPGPYQHLLQARVPAAEEGLPLVRAANSGISAVVDAYGRLAGSLPSDAVGVLDAALPAVLPITISARLGDVLLPAQLLLTGISIILWKVYL